MIQAQIDQLGTQTNEKYLMILEAKDIHVHPTTASSHLGRGTGEEIAAWVVPLGGAAGKAAKYGEKVLQKRIGAFLERCGLKIDQATFKKAFTRTIEQELVYASSNLTKEELAHLIEQRAAKKASEEAGLQAQRRATPKTAPSATKVETASSSVKKTLESVEGISSKELQRLEQEISKWLGEETKLIRNKAGDLVFLSKDGMRKVRFDFNRPFPHESPHLHFERFERGEWEELKRVYPADLPHK